MRRTAQVYLFFYSQSNPIAESACAEALNDVFMKAFSTAPNRSFSKYGNDARFPMNPISFDIDGIVRMHSTMMA